MGSNLGDLCGEVLKMVEVLLVLLAIGVVVVLNDGVVLVANGTRIGSAYLFQGVRRAR